MIMSEKSNPWFERKFIDFAQTIVPYGKVRYSVETYCFNNHGLWGIWTTGSIWMKYSWKGRKTRIPWPPPLPSQYIYIYSGNSVIRTPIFRNYRIFRRQLTVPTFFTIIYCKNVTDFSNFDFSKKSIFRTNSSVPIKEIPIKIPC